MTFDQVSTPRKGVVAFIRMALERLVMAQAAATKDLPPMLYRFPPL
jgi:hypothetical protein